MRLDEIAEKLGFELLNDADTQREVAKGYASDLMSDVIAHAETGDVWITLQVHMNMVAVAGMKELAAVVLCSGRRPGEDVLRNATEQNVPIYTSHLPAFEIAGRLYELGLRGV